MANPMRMRTIPKIVAHETPTLTPANPTTRPIINKAAPTNPLKFIILAPLASLDHVPVMHNGQHHPDAEIDKPHHGHKSGKPI
jgi:hypothetical protein